ncbi:hypothetical protein F5Y11DRAFT_247415 [Daldinia sp. FL1419]|nr:hypothetical protein F5Y11DRAFT_247415 [Daldinia sp. FL1419]
MDVLAPDRPHGQPDPATHQDKILVDYRILSGRKIRMIESWVSEVLSNPGFCTCSRPDIAPPRITDEESPSTSTLAAIPEDEPQSHRSSSVRIKHPSGSSSINIGSGRPNLSSCPSCQSPLDEAISLKKLRELEDLSFVRKGSPRSSAGSSKLSPIPVVGDGHKPIALPKHKPIVIAKPEKRMGPSKEQLLKPFQKLKVFGSRTVATSRRLKAKVLGMKSLRIRLMERQGKLPQSGDDVEARASRPRATNVYAQYRLNASSAGSVETLAGLSDDERRRPGLTVDESAARLRRAARLLNRKSVLADVPTAPKDTKARA